MLGTIEEVIIGELSDEFKKGQEKHQQKKKTHWFVFDSFIRLIYILLGNLTPPVSVKGKAVRRKKGASIEREDGMWSA